MDNNQLAEVLEEYALASPDEFDQSVLRRFKDKYPQFSGELEDFAVAQTIAKCSPEVELTAQQEAHYRTSALEALRSVRGEMQTVLQSLIETAKVKGLNRKELAEKLGLSVSLVQYLEKRRLEFSSIPKKLIEKIASVLEQSEASVVEFLNLPSAGTANANFKTATRPEALKPKKFEEAVREDQSLSHEEKQKLLEI